VPALRGAQLCQPRLWVAPELTRPQVGVLGWLKLTAQAVNLTLHIEGIANGIAVGGGQVPGARAFRVVQRLLPLSRQLENL
jgi:hypothetical protein